MADTFLPDYVVRGQIRERGIEMENSCARFTAIRSAREKIRAKPPTYSQDELDRLFAKANFLDHAIFTTSLLTGLRRDELRFLVISDIDLIKKEIRVTAKEGFIPKNFEEREIPIPDELVEILRKLPHTSRWVFTSTNGKQFGRNHLLLHLQRLAKTIERRECYPSQVPVYLSHERSTK